MPPFFSLSGRINRFQFAFLSLIPIALYYVGIWIGLQYGMVGALLVLLVPFVMLPLFVRRLHDFDRSGAWAVWAVIPLVTLPFWVYCAFMPGTPKANRFGECVLEKKP